MHVSTLEMLPLHHFCDNSIHSTPLPIRVYPEQGLDTGSTNENNKNSNNNNSNKSNTNKREYSNDSVRSYHSEITIAIKIIHYL